MRGIWEETPRGLRLGCVALWVVGVVLLGLGWWGDRTGFWADKSFVTNVFSSVTAAAFGVPLALVVLNRVAMVQAEAVEVRAGLRLAMRVVGDFAASVPRLVPGPAARLDDAAAGLLALERLAQAALKDWGPNGDDGALADLRQQLADGTLENALEDFRAAMRPGSQAVPAVAEMAAHWSFLNTTVRSRLLETGGSWLSAHLAAQIDEYVSRLTADAYLDGWLRDLDIALRRFTDGSDVPQALQELWRQLEMGSEVAEAVIELGTLSREACAVLAPAGARTAA
ncbi:hypothetical protein OHA45_36840 [Streptomyces lydicus]|uniref:hypothetical protein n=1 Tax=Streptomyces lydicus TaxID=47763 RepID=UPI002E321F1F|nr:hypothetical protein [Streptomyces lydicus]